MPGWFGEAAAGTVRLGDPALWTQWALRLGVALAIAIVGWWLSKLLASGLGRVLQRVGVDQILRDFLTGVAHAIGLVVVLVAALDALGVPTTSLLAVLGAAGLAIGLALKDSLSNIASGVMLIVLRPFRAGDSVLVAGQDGTVEHVRIFQTRLRTAQNHDVILPNSQITAGPIVNFTAQARRRIDISLAVGYDEPLARARELLLQVAKDNPRVLADPAPSVGVSALEDARVVLQLLAWVDTSQHVGTRGQLLEGILDTFTAEGLSLQVAKPPQVTLIDERSPRPATTT